MNLNSFLPTLMLVVLTLAGGCSKNPAATVSGTITVDGQPIPRESNVSGTVMFYPKGRGAAGYGVVRDGSYEIQTGGAVGLQPGEYDVTVRVVRIDPPPPDGNPPGQTLLHKPHFEDRRRSGLRFSVQPGANVFDIAVE